MWLLGIGASRPQGGAFPVVGGSPFGCTGCQ